VYHGWDDTAVSVNGYPQASHCTLRSLYPTSVPLSLSLCLSLSLSLSLSLFLPPRLADPRERSESRVVVGIEGAPTRFFRLAIARDRRLLDTLYYDGKRESRADRSVNIRAVRPRRRIERETRNPEEFRGFRRCLRWPG